MITVLECTVPRPRVRTERLRASVLGSSGGCINSPPVRRLGLCFGDQDPLQLAWGVLKAQGFSDPESLRHACVLPAQALICRADAANPPLQAASLAASDLLEHLLWLGLCTDWMLDPSRPVLWTRASLTRRLEVFTGEGFYA